MSIRTIVKSRIDAARIAHRINNDEGLWTFAANTWYKLIEPYTPFDTGLLLNEVLIEPKKIYYIMNYAKPVYEGTHMNFQTLHHPLATHHWDQAAKPAQLPKLKQAMQAYIDKRMKL